MLKETYFAIVKKLPAGVQKEYVMRGRFNHILAPSWTLINDWKNAKITWNEYEQRYKDELFNNPEAIQRMLELQELAKTQDVYLICFEKSPRFCHRSLLLKWITEI